MNVTLSSLETLFDLADTDRSGYIEADEFKRLCEGVIPEGDDRLPADIFRELDVDGDGRISRSEFLTGFRRTTRLVLYRRSASGENFISDEDDADDLDLPPSSSHPQHQTPLAISQQASAFSLPNGRPITNHPNNNYLGMAPSDSQKLAAHNVLSHKSSAPTATATSAMTSQKRDVIANGHASPRPRRKSSLVTGSAGGGGGGRLPWLSQESVDEATQNGRIFAAVSWEKFLTSLGLNFYLLSYTSQEQVCDLYQQLYACEQPQLLTHFEDVILAVIADIRQQQTEIERLENSFKREREQHTSQLRLLEEEMEGQMLRVESSLLEKEREKLQNEKEALRQKFEAELAEMQHNLRKVQLASGSATADKMVDELRSRLDDVQYENVTLKNNLTEAQTTVVVLRTETTTLKQQFQEKCRELDSEKEAIVAYVQETENLRKQLEIMQESNKRLHDANDDLRSAVENSLSQPTRRPTAAQLASLMALQQTSSPALRNEYVQEYLNASSRSAGGGQSLAEELISAAGAGSGARRAHDTYEVDSLPDDFDSGHSTFRDHDVDSELDAVRGGGRHGRGRHAYHRRQPQDAVAIDEESSEGEVEDDDADVIGSRALAELPDGRSGSVHADVISLMSLQSGRGSLRSHGSLRSRQGSVLKKLAAANEVKVITAEPERIFKVVLAGDAAVGKSSFILRLCKGKFVGNLSSTLGVDFHTKTLEVDGHVVALQLWDTAGQERFRSIAKSYFRRADGVILLYDCTYERSFVNVRDWIAAVEEGAEKKIPIMIAANKTDLREQLKGDDRRCVSTEDGDKLAKQFSAMFIETSAKSGENILESVTELARVLRTNQDLEVKAVGLSLHDYAGEKKGLCCK